MKKPRPRKIRQEQRRTSNREKKQKSDEMIELMKAQTENHAITMMEKMHNNRMKMLGSMIEIVKK